MLSVPRILMFVIDALLIAAAYLAAFLLRFDMATAAMLEPIVWWTLPVIWACQAACYLALGVNRTVWRYVSLVDVIRLSVAAVAGALLFAVLVNKVFMIGQVPRSIYLLDPLLTVTLLTSARIGRRMLYDSGHTKGAKRVLIYGGGGAGEMIVRDMKRNPYDGYLPLGFIDDDTRKHGRSIHGVKVLGGRAELPAIMAKTRPDEVLLAMPHETSSTIRAVFRALEQFPVPVKTLPNLHELVDRNVGLTDLRSVNLHDLLGRSVVAPDPTPVRDLIRGRVILVTGAGGSIGSELCRQVWALQPRMLIMLERYENALYEIEKELRDRDAGPELVAAIGDVNDRRRVESVLLKYPVEIIFHAAAHKHVPLMEMNPCEAIKNNVLGTRRLGEAAAQYKVERFILISTDKAVNPTSVMGASKRVAELVIQEIASRRGIKFGVVRFGNVLGSNGSVVPRFLEQIKARGPVTITHPDMRRFFMLIPEAVELVLHASALMEPAAAYMLEMGEQIRIEDMARHLIRLAGYIPGSDIPIEYTGIRPGEKLYEELLGPDECEEPTPVAGVRRIRALKAPDFEWLQRQLIRLEAVAAMGDESAVRDELAQIVPTYRSPDLAEAAESLPRLQPTGT
ncbi:MAG TPA: nucleoside-diphosphate sugar epimerase/dehydratase [Terriglobales bacterium]|nr:nucleoside-diphosphate sugar epimerase/dehydratase [Terriglobales bacterium]